MVYRLFWPPFSRRQRFGLLVPPGVDHPGIQINQPFLIQANVQPFKQLLERAVTSPITKALIHSRPWAEALRQIAKQRLNTRSEDAI